MNASDALTLIEAAVRGHGGVWADIGAGDGTFTRALIELLPPGSRVYAVDRDASAIAGLRELSDSGAANLIAVNADFTQPLELPQLGGGQLDGMLLANSLHFVRDAERVLARLVTIVKPGGRVVLIEYDRSAATRWVPFPISRQSLPALAAAAGLTPPVITAERPSAYQGILYVAAATRIHPPRP